MKNFPHQYSDFPKIRDTLAVIADMESANQAVNDDGLLGYGLARRLIYRFRDFDYETEGVAERLASRIEDELRKPASSQGARTAAREMRRTLQFLGWVDNHFSITAEGRELLATDPGSEEERVALAAALMGGVLAEEGVESHPGIVLLRLVAEHGPLDSRDGMELSLEARDDSEEEFERISGLLGLPHSERAETIGASEAQLANAVKILPSLALQAGLLAADPSGGFRITVEGLTALGSSAERRTVGERPPPVPRQFRPATSAQRRSDRTTVARDRTIRGEARTLSASEQIEAMRLRLERTVQHQSLVRELAGLAPDDWEIFEDLLGYDLLMVPSEEPLILWEAKTIVADAAHQVRAAVGQLLYYEHFHVAARWPGREVEKAALFDADIAVELADFLHELDIGAFKHDGQALIPLNETARAILARLSPP